MVRLSLALLLRNKHHPMYEEITACVPGAKRESEPGKISLRLQRMSALHGKNFTANLPPPSYKISTHYYLTAMNTAKQGT